MKQRPQTRKIDTKFPPKPPRTDMKKRGKPHVKHSHDKRIPPFTVEELVMEWAGNLVVEQFGSKQEILNSSSSKLYKEPLTMSKISMEDIEDTTVSPDKRTNSNGSESLTRRPEIEIVNDQDKNVSPDIEKNGHELDTTQDAGSESWVIQVKERFCTQQYKEGQPSNVSIYRVPETIRAPKPAAYVPLVASFGPYHHRKKDKRLDAIDDYKLEAVQRTIERIDGLTIDKLIAEVGNLEKRIRNCYEDSANEYSKDTLCWMLTMDACFILEFFRTSVTKSSKEEDKTKSAKEEEHAKEQERFSLLFEYNGRQNIFRSLQVSPSLYHHRIIQ